VASLSDKINDRPVLFALLKVIQSQPYGFVPPQPAGKQQCQQCAVASEWGPSENNRRARFYRLTRAGEKLLQTEKRDWEQTAAIIGRFFEVKAEDLA
jgi:hypothetical protein